MTATPIVSRHLSGQDVVLAARHIEQGNAAFAARRYDDALRSYDAALRAQPTLAEGYGNRGSVLAAQGNWAEAVRNFDLAIALKPQHPDAYGNKGVALAELKRYGEAIAAFDAALRIRPDSPAILSNRGSALRELKQFDQAIESLRAALALAPNRAGTHYNLGNAFFDACRLEEAIASFDRAIAARPGYAEAFSNRGNALRDAGRLEDAIASYDQAIALRRDLKDTYICRGSALLGLGRLREAYDSYDGALSLDPSFAEAQWGKAHCELLQGNFEAGLPLYEYRRAIRRSSFPQELLGVPLPAPDDLTPNKTVLVRWEQGFGDVIQFSRYLPMLSARVGRVLATVPKALVALLRQLEPSVTILEDGSPAAQGDIAIPLASLPLVFGTTRTSIPQPGPYLKADPDRVARWRERIGAEGFRIGVCWQGSTGPIDLGRSFPVACFAPVGALPPVRLVSLHKGAGEAQLASLPDGLRIETLGEDFDPPGASFLDTAAVMEVCDLVITSDTAVAHLAGALGVPTWVALKSVPDWRWMLGQEGSPWYPSLRLFRQTESGAWGRVFERMASEIATQLLTAGGSP